MNQSAIPLRRLDGSSTSYGAGRAWFRSRITSSQISSASMNPRWSSMNAFHPASPSGCVCASGASGAPFVLLPLPLLRLPPGRAAAALASPASAQPIVVEASAPGLQAVTVSVPTSVDAAVDSVLAVAEKHGSEAVLGFD